MYINTGIMLNFRPMCPLHVSHRSPIPTLRDLHSGRYFRVERFIDLYVRSDLHSSCCPLVEALSSARSTAVVVARVPRVWANAVYQVRQISPARPR